MVHVDLTGADDDLLRVDIGEVLPICVVIGLEVRIGVHHHQPRPVGVEGEVCPCEKREKRLEV